MIFQCNRVRIGVLIALLGSIMAAGVRSESVPSILRFSLRPADGSNVEFGKATGCLATVKNVSDRAVVVQIVVPLANRAESQMSFAGSVYGVARKAEREDGYDFNPLEQQPGGPFWVGLLLPGEEVSLRCGYVFCAQTESFSVRFQVAPQPYDGSAASLAPWKIYLPEEPQGTGADSRSIPTKYVPFSTKRWQQIVAANSEVRPLGPDISPRAVIIEGLSGKAVEQRFDVPMRYEGDSFVLEAARKRAAELTSVELDKVELAYCEMVGGYLVTEGRQTWILKNADQAERGTMLPAFPPRFLRDLSGGGTVKVRIGGKQEGFGPEEHPAGRVFWDAYPVFYGDGMYTSGEFITLTKEQAMPFLAEVGARGGQLRIHYYYFDARYYELVLPGGSEAVQQTPRRQGP